MQVAVLSPVAPFPANSGYKLAVASDLAALERLGCRVRVFSWHLPEELPHTLPRPSFEMEYAAARRGGRGVRYARSLGRSKPAAIERYYSRSLQRQLHSWLRGFRADLVIVEDVVLGGWCSLLRDVQPQAPLVVRWHNVMDQVAEREYRNAPITLKPLFRAEWRRWRQWERRVLRAADRCWAISPGDTERLGSVSGSRPVAHLTVALDMDRYSRVPVGRGDPQTVLHLGTLDLRKGQGLATFIDRQWPAIRAVRPQARLLLAGNSRVSLRGLKADGVTWLGAAACDATFYERGRFSLNSQTVGGGIKLKSLTSLAAGRTLLSFDHGIDGLELRHGEHFWSLDRLRDENDWARLWESDARNGRLAEAGRQWVRDHHGPETVAGQLAALLADAGHGGSRAA